MTLQLAILGVAAILEIVGVALIRMGLEQRSLLILAGAVLLASYGLIVNQGELDFGRLMGCYIAAFFVVSQLVAMLLFHQTPSLRTIIGGLLIVCGGVAILV